MSKKVRPPATGPANMAQIKFNEDANSDKVSESGFNFFWTSGVETGLLGDISATTRCGKYKPVYVFNNSAVMAYVAFGDATLLAPAGPAAGIPIAAGTGLMLSSGPNEFVCASGADVFAYVASENVVE